MPKLAGIPLLLAALATSAACSSSSTSTTCASVCQHVGDCGGTSCLALCLTAESACNTANESSVFQSWASCGPVFNCVNDEFVPANCAPQQDALLVCGVGVTTHDAGMPSIMFPDATTGHDASPRPDGTTLPDAGVDAPLADTGPGPCGACPGTCTNGECLVALASGCDQPDQVAVDGTSVYWTEVSGGSVSTVPKGGGPASALASGQGSPYGIALDATSVYWTTNEDDGAVVKIGKSGAGLTTLATGQNQPAGIAVGGSTVYWTNSAFGEPGYVLDMGSSGGSIITLGQGESPVGIAVNGSALYWANEGSGPSTGSVMRYAFNGSAAVTLAGSLNAPSAIALDSSNVYWVTEDGFAMKAPLTGGLVTTLASQQNDPLAIATDGTSVYWTNNGDGSVVKVGVNGGATTTIATGSGNMGGIAVDATSVYWAAYTSGTIMKATPK
jgi:sugar lactone lactonase YvrE